VQGGQTAGEAVCHLRDQPQAQAATGVGICHCEQSEAILGKEG